MSIETVVDVVEPLIEPLTAAAVEMANAAKAVGEQVAMTAQGAIPATGRILSRFVYSVFYYASYGIVFPTLFVANVVPGCDSIADGLLDGARAAGDVIEERK